MKPLWKEVVVEIVVLEVVWTARAMEEEEEEEEWAEKAQAWMLSKIGQFVK